MACCILAALIIGNILALWHARRRIAVYAGVAILAVLIVLFGLQWGVHRPTAGLGRTLTIRP